MLVIYAPWRLTGRKTSSIYLYEQSIGVAMPSYTWAFLRWLLPAKVLYTQIIVQLYWKNLTLQLSSFNEVSLSNL